MLRRKCCSPRRHLLGLLAVCLACQSARVRRSSRLLRDSHKACVFPAACLFSTDRPRIVSNVPTQRCRGCWRPGPWEPLSLVSFLSPVEPPTRQAASCPTCPTALPWLLATGSVGLTAAAAAPHGHDLVPPARPPGRSCRAPRLPPGFTSGQRPYRSYFRSHPLCRNHWWFLF